MKRTLLPFAFLIQSTAVAQSTKELSLLAKMTQCGNVAIVSISNQETLPQQSILNLSDGLYKHKTHLNIESLTTKHYAMFVVQAAPVVKALLNNKEMTLTLNTEETLQVCNRKGLEFIGTSILHYTATPPPTITENLKYK